MTDKRMTRPQPGPLTELLFLKCGHAGSRRTPQVISKLEWHTAALAYCSLTSPGRPFTRTQDATLGCVLPSYPQHVYLSLNGRPAYCTARQRPTVPARATCGGHVTPQHVVIPRQNAGQSGAQKLGIPDLLCSKAGLGAGGARLHWPTTTWSPSAQRKAGERWADRLA